VHGILPAEIDAILAVAEQWGPVDRSHRKLAHRGSYEGLVWVAPSTFQRVLAAQGLVLPEPLARTPAVKKPWPDWLVWEPNRIWIWDVTHFTRARRAVFAIVDMVSRRWIDTLVSVEETSTQVRVIFERALESEGLLDLLTDERLDLAVDDPARPILLAVSDNGPQMTSTDTRAFMALLAIVQHHGRPHTPTDQGWIESFFGHVKGEWPHLEDIEDPVVLEAELTRVRTEHNSVRLHEAIGYVTPTTSTKEEEKRSAKPAGKASHEPDRNGSTTTAGTPTRTPRRHRDLVHYRHDLRGKVRHASAHSSPVGSSAQNGVAPNGRSGADSHAEVRAVNRRDCLGWSGHLHVRRTLPPEDVQE
jgi:transposase InsO family protein